MKTMHLFAGAGGGLLADLILGHTPIVAVEWDKNACRTLRNRIADGWFPGLHLHEQDVRMFDPSPYAGQVDCISAGFPCQDISVAGKGAGIAEGTRSGLYREVIRIAGELRPQYLFLENVPAILVRGGATVIADVAALGYDCTWTTLRASDVGAPHQRNRWWCLCANPDRVRESQSQGSQQDKRGRTGNVRQEMADASGTGCEKQNTSAFTAGTGYGTRSTSEERDTSWWGVEPSLGRVAHGVAHPFHRIKSLGNGQVPLQAAAAWCILQEAAA